MSIFCVLPPHILVNIAHHGDAEQKRFALETLVSGERMRGHREVLSRYNMARKGLSGLNRIVMSAEHKQSLVGPALRKEGDPETGDKSVDETYEFVGDAYDFYKDVFDRDSIDGQGMKILCTVHYGQEFTNAFWNGERLVFGDGDKKIFGRFTRCLEVTGHEITHGVTNTAAQIKNFGQSGALGESISDIFGCLIKQKKLGQKAGEANWIIGDGLFTRQINGVGIRNLKEPGTAYNDPLLGQDPTPASMADYVDTKDDNGGIHINCTIPSHAFYLASVDLGGHAWQKMGKVWYNTVQRRIRDTRLDFQSFAAKTLKVCNRLFGEGQETRALNRAWQAVKVI